MIYLECTGLHANHSLFCVCVMLNTLRYPSLQCNRFETLPDEMCTVSAISYTDRLHATSLTNAFTRATNFSLQLHSMLFLILPLW